MTNSRRPFTAATANRTLGAVMLAFLAACAADPTATPEVPEAAQVMPQVAAAVNGPAQYVQGELLVKFRGAATSLSRGALLKAARAELAERILTPAMRDRGDFEGVSVLRTTMSVPEAIAALRSNPDVEYAEPNWIYQHEATANDPQLPQLWGMQASSATGFGSGAVTSWAANTPNCSSVYVGIIDEGYYYNHVDLAANASVNPGEIAGNKKDDDGNGYIDDVRGWDFDGNNAEVFDGVNDDHGTHVAGTIGAVGNNGVGVVGMCWSIKLLNAKFLGIGGGTTANAIKSVDYFTGLKNKGLNIVATSNSWGGGGYSQGLRDAIERANVAGVLFVAAAGNSTVNCDGGTCFPAGYDNDNLISVASITSTGDISSFSNYGLTTIDIGAPGSGIISTVPVASGRRNVTSGYASYSGTSMATPHVSGAAALYKARNPSATAAQIKAAILNAATPTASLAGKVLTGGRLNVSTF